MTIFIVVAALMTALAAAAVVIPLCRDRRSRVLGTIAGVLVAGAAAGLYPLWSNWDWHATANAPAASPDVMAMVAKLEAHLRDDPKDKTGWTMLGRSYVTLERLDDGIRAYDHAVKLDPDDADAAMGLGEALSLKDGGSITPAAGQLFEHALALKPDNPKALLYGGFAAAERGDVAAARSRWLALKALHPPAALEQLLDARIAELGPAPVGTPAIAPAGAAASPPAQVTVNVTLSPALGSKLTREAPLFIFAREPGASGPPLAAKRLTSASLGTEIHLSAADSMLPGRVLLNGHQVSVTARVSFSGQPLPAAGDLYGELIYDVGHDGARNLVIDRIAD